MDRAAEKIRKDLLNLTYQCIDYQCILDDEYGERDDFKDNNVETHRRAFRSNLFVK